MCVIQFTKIINLFAQNLSYFTKMIFVCHMRAKSLISKQRTQYLKLRI